MENYAHINNFFRKWTSDMAYILGFMAADGSVIISHPKDRPNPRYYFCITSKDFRHLQKIKKVLLVPQKIYSKRSGYTNKKDNYQLQIENKSVCEDLMKLGIIPRKTYYMKFPKIPDNYIIDFIRGFFDGDGTVYIYTVNRTPQIKVSFVGDSRDFIFGLNNVICNRLKIPLKNIHKNSSKNKVDGHTIHFYIDDCVRLAELMYKNKNSLFLFRKYNIFKKWENINRRKYKKINYPSKIGWRLNQKVSVR